MEKKNQLYKIRSKAWKFYNSWRKKPSYSPALKTKVVISRQGWNHISGAYWGKKRTFADIIRRLALLPKAKEIIEKLSMIQNIEKRGKRTYYTLEAMVEVEEKGKKVSRKVRVILFEDKKGKKIFYSVMDSKPRKRSK